LKLEWVKYVSPISTNEGTPASSLWDSHVKIGFACGAALEWGIHSKRDVQQPLNHSMDFKQWII
jgi:hypothetical protein